jgi:hypothetical protein
MAHIRNNFRSNCDINSFVISLHQSRNNFDAPIETKKASFLLLAEAGANPLQACGAEQC